jgi:hypothetical protein
MGEKIIAFKSFISLPSSQEHLSAEVHCIKSSQENLMKIDKVVLTAIAFSLTVIAVLVLKNIGVL